MLLADLVSKDAVKAQLAARIPELLDDPESSESGFFEQHYLVHLDGIAAEVADITGDPPPRERQALAVQAVVLGTAMSIESALYPEQINGDNSRAEQLRERYTAVLAQLKLSFPAIPVRVRTGRAFSVWLG